jgi:hypothetical protein
MSTDTAEHGGSTDAPPRPLPVLAVAEGAFPAQHERLVEHVDGRATLRLADVSSAQAVAASTAGADAVVVTSPRPERRGSAW